MDKNNTDREHWRGAFWMGEFSKRYFQNKVSAKEKKVFENWNPEEGNEPDLRLYGVTPDTERLWTSISSKVGLSSQTTNSRNFSRMFRRYAAAAAILVFLAGGLYYSYTGIEEAFSPTGKYYFATGPEIRHYTLSDGSVVSLNKDTKLSIIEKEFNKDRREVWLEEGEAFFEVTKNPEKPFIVHTQTIMTTVKGTSFNIKAYKELDENVLSVRSGKVQVNLGKAVIGDFTKNKRMTFHKSSKRIDKDEVDWHDAAAWTEGRLVLKSADIKELQLRLRQHYGVTVDISGDALKNTLLNASYPKGAKLETVLEGIGLVYSVKYSITGNKVILYN